VALILNLKVGENERLSFHTASVAPGLLSALTYSERKENACVRILTVKDNLGSTTRRYRASVLTSFSSRIGFRKRGKTFVR